MPGTNAGTGIPLHLRCAKCKVRRPWRNPGDHTGMNLEATGRVKSLTVRESHRQNARTLPYKAEYRCLDCGHTGWSKHDDMAHLLRRKGIQVHVRDGAMFILKQDKKIP